MMKRNDELEKMLGIKGLIIYSLILGFYSLVIAGFAFYFLPEFPGKNIVRAVFGVTIFNIIYFLKGYELIKEIKSQKIKENIGEKDWIKEAYLR